MLFEVLVIVAVVAVGVLWTAYKYPALFGMASQQVGSGVEKAAWAVKDSVEAKADELTKK